MQLRTARLRSDATRAHAVIWRWLYTISYEQWLWSALMVNQFEGQAYSDYCHGAGSTLEAVAGLLPGPALAPPAQLATMAGAWPLCPSAAHMLTAPLRAAALGSTGCSPLRGSDLLDTFELNARSKWASLGYAALTFPVLCLAFYIGVRNVRHEHR